MDPYLESHWLDVHVSLIAATRNVLNDRLPQDLVASAEERIAIESEDDDRRRDFGPDVRILEPAAGEITESESTGTATAAAPIRLLAVVEPITERFIRIIESGTEKLITVIEFVSPTNKKNPGLYDFRAKRAHLIAAGVNFVEIDLTRDGDWRALLRPHRCSPRRSTPYRVTIRVPSDPAGVGLYPIPLRERIPPIVIPLRDKDPEFRLELQPLMDQAYANGRYDRRLDYTKPPTPPLEGDDVEWARHLLESRPS
jgi:hypothetical protein